MKSSQRHLFAYLKACGRFAINGNFSHFVCKYLKPCNRSPKGMLSKRPKAVMVEPTNILFTKRQPK